MSVVNQIESVRIRGFLSFKDVRIEKLPRLAVLIGANGAGKSNFIRFFEMMNKMLGPRRLGEFVRRQGGADDQLHDGSRVTPRMEAEVTMRTEQGANDYKFTLTHAHPDRLMFSEEAFRFSRVGLDAAPEWQHLGSGHTEAGIVLAARSPESAEVNQTTAGVIVNLLRSCAVYQFHDTSRSL